MILLTIADAEPTPVQLVARLLARDKAQITRAIKSLESKGLIARNRTEADARVSLLSLTEKGHQVVSRIRVALSEVIGEVLAPLSEAEQEQLKDLLARATAGCPPQVRNCEPPDR